MSPFPAQVKSVQYYIEAGSSDMLVWWMLRGAMKDSICCGACVLLSTMHTCCNLGMWLFFGLFDSDDTVLTREMIMGSTFQHIKASTLRHVNAFYPFSGTALF